jgi:hypothetical protein
MQNRIFSLIRESCAFVAEKAVDVRINTGFLEDYCRALPISLALNPTMDKENHLCEDDELTLAYFITLDCINFGSGYFAELSGAGEKNGYFAVASSWKNEIVRLQSVSAKWLMSLTAADCCRIFAQKTTNAASMQLMQLFAAALNELGRFLQQEFCGSPVRMIESASQSAASLAEILCSMPFYRDVFNYGNREVYLLKRAQITASDLNFALGGQSYGRFVDIDELTIFADNLVPHVLRHDGLLDYSSELQKRIGSKELIESGCAAEIEIRACSVHAVELLRRTYADMGIHVTSQQLDYMLWNLGQQPEYKRSPTHQTKCVFY